MGNELLALICPDWRPAALVLDAANGEVAYANWRCLRLFEKRVPVWVAGGRLRFASPTMRRRFRPALKRALAQGVETSVLIERLPDGVGMYSAAIRNPQGLFTEALGRHLGRERRLVIVEFTTSSMVPSQHAMEAVGRTFDLSPVEFQLLSRLVSGHAESRRWSDLARDGQVATDGLDGLLAKARCHQPEELVKLVMSTCSLDIDS